MTDIQTKRTLLRGGHVISLDKNIGDIADGDVLIEGSTIVEMGHSIAADGAEVVDTSSMVVMPGLIDTHRHTWQTALRGAVDAGSYFATVLVRLGPLFRPEDVYIGNLLGAVSALNSGITTMLDWSHIMNSPEHADAAVQGLSESGIRGSSPTASPRSGCRPGSAGPTPSSTPTTSAGYSASTSPPRISC
jgi:5-methylthioadenosine/S-adenosylhomocysteine deaminase